MSQIIETRLRKEVVRLAWPILIQGLLGTVIMFTDRLILGRYSADALASMQAAGPITWATFNMYGAFGIGVLAVIGRATGAADAAQARGVLSSSLVIALGVGAVLGLAGFGGRDIFAHALLGDAVHSATARVMATDYLAWVFACAPFTTLGVTLSYALQASGDTRSPMWISLLAGSANLILSWIFVFGHLGAPEMGIHGAALGTAASTVIVCLISFWVMQRPQRILRIGRPNFPTLRPVIKVAVPALGERIIFHVGFLTFAGFVGHLGTKAMAAHQACMAIESLGFIASYALGSANGTIVAQKLGAGSPSDARKATYFTVRLSLALMCLIGLIFWFFAHPLVALFCADPETIRLGVDCMRVAAVAQPIMAVTDAFAGGLRGAGDTKSPMIVALIGPVLVRVAASWLFAFEFELGLVGIWLGSTLDWLVRGIWLSIVFGRGRWATIKLG
ncbi:MAG: MATE family efflux transporter [Myxococcota bacterium]|nr:MATE family efflux transporter [Myxococcota bacterium]